MVRLLLGLVVVLLLGACATRSISDSDYSYGRSTYMYRGELSEFNVLGISAKKEINEQDIAQALAARDPLSIQRGTRIMLIQSGAMFPDEAMVSELGKNFTVGGFTGIPSEPNGNKNEDKAEQDENYSLALRLAAARGGYETLVVYWGILESARENLATKTVSWVPIVGQVLPDEQQHMRIRLKFIVMNVKDGRWEQFLPEPFADSALSNRMGREGSDQQQVALLKAQGYSAAAKELVQRYVR